MSHEQYENYSIYIVCGLVKSKINIFLMQNGFLLQKVVLDIYVHRNIAISAPSHPILIIFYFSKNYLNFFLFRSMYSINCLICNHHLLVFVRLLMSRCLGYYSSFVDMIIIIKYKPMLKHSYILK